MSMLTNTKESRSAKNRNSLGNLDKRAANQQNTSKKNKIQCVYKGATAHSHNGTRGKSLFPLHKPKLKNTVNKRDTSKTDLSKARRCGMFNRNPSIML